MGKTTANSPKAFTTLKSITPTSTNPIKIDPGPPVLSAPPEPMKRPVPMDPPSAIIFFVFFLYAGV